MTGAPTIPGYRDPFADSPAYYYDPEAAERPVRFFERYCRHVKGELAGELIELMDWQADLLRVAYGTKRRADGLRRYRTIYMEVARKNAKSTFAAGLALYHLVGEGEKGAEAISAAGSREQAGIVHGIAKSMVRLDPVLSSRLRNPLSEKSPIYDDATESRYYTVSREAGTVHGANGSAIIVDELHVHRTRDLLDTLVTSQGSRAEPMLAILTTAGDSQSSIAYAEHLHAIAVASGEIEDASYLPVVFWNETDADWRDEETWRRANPGLGQSVRLDYLREQCDRAKLDPTRETAFRRLHCNQWVGEAKAALRMEDYDRAPAPRPLDSRRVYVAFDLSSTTDLTAWAACAVDDTDPTAKAYDWEFHAYVPADRIEAKERHDRVPYRQWQRDGYLTATPGAVVDYDWMLRDLDALAERCDVESVGFDPWGSAAVVTALEKRGYTVVEVRQGFATLSAPTKALSELILQGRFRHGNNPVARWCAQNLVVDTDPAGNVKPNKARSRQRIDVTVAAIMALDRALRVEGRDESESRYETGGIRWLQ